MHKQRSKPVVPDRCYRSQILVTTSLHDERSQDSISSRRRSAMVFSVPAPTAAMSSASRRGRVIRGRPLHFLSVPVLIYNSGTWGLTQRAEQSLDSFHRRQLRTLLGIKWPQRIRNSALYERCQCESLSSLIRKNRWRLFGHILRLPDNTPAKLSMIHYFKSTERTAV